MLQYADDLAVYVSHVDVENVQRTVQSACDGLNGIFMEIGLPISELVLFSRKHINPSVCVTLNGQCMPVVPKFRYLGVVFDRKLLWGRALHSAELLQTTKLFAICGRAKTPGCLGQTHEMDRFYRKQHNDIRFL
jgi:hypothetical protein